MDLSSLERVLAERGEKPFRYKQITKSFFSGAYTGFDELTDISTELRTVLTERVPWLTVSAVTDSKSKDGTRKILFELGDGSNIESVLMKYADGRNTVCVSSQVGCAMGCAFCATGKQGLTRNLSAYEIIDQVEWFRQTLKRELSEDIDNVVYMGMGEPLMNYDAVAESIRVLQDPKLGNMGWRRLSVSTSGVVPGIHKLAIDFPQVNLAVSLHASTDAVRSKLMPINKGFPISDLMRACEKYVEITNRKVFFEYILLRGVNDKKEHARELAKLMNKHPLFHVNIIPYNTTNSDFSAPRREHAYTFGGWLKEHGVHLVTIRRSFGDDIAAACGQLAGNT